MNLKDIARSLGINLEGDEPKRLIERLIEQARQNLAVRDFPVDLSIWKTLQNGNTWLADFDLQRSAGTFNLINLYPRPARGKGASLVFTSDMILFLNDLNKFNKTNWMGKLLNQDNTKYLLSQNGKGDIYLPAVGGFGGNQVRIRETVGGFAEIDAIDPNDLPDPDDVRTNPSLVHIYTAWNGKRVTYPGYPIFFPVFRVQGQVAYVEKRLLK